MTEPRTGRSCGAEKLSAVGSERVTSGWVARLKEFFTTSVPPMERRVVAYAKEVAPSSVTYRVAGTRIEVYEIEKMLLRKYPPAGYGTRVTSRRTLSDGWEEAVIQRSASCD